MNKFKALSIVVIVVLSSCGRDLPELKGIELERWQADESGCTGIREQATETLQAQKYLLLGLSEMQIVNLLGKPDHNELFKRNQKFYFYFLQPGKDCPNQVQDPKYLKIRFNAMGLAKEVSIDPISR